MPFCFISKSLPVNIQGDIFMKKAKQMIWLHCWKRAASVSKHCEPLSHDKSSQPTDISMAGFWVCSLKSSFPLLTLGKYSQGLQHPSPCLQLGFLLASPAYCSSCLRILTYPHSLPIGEVNFPLLKHYPLNLFSDLRVHILFFSFKGLWPPLGMEE